jgi:hypothetical protein
LVIVGVGVVIVVILVLGDVVLVMRAFGVLGRWVWFGLEIFHKGI